jgi:hypothetical protein
VNTRWRCHKAGTPANIVWNAGADRDVAGGFDLPGRRGGYRGRRPGRGKNTNALTQHRIYPE